MGQGVQVDIPHVKGMSEATGNASTLHPQEPLAFASPNTERFLGRGNLPFTAQQLVLAEPHTCHARETSLTCAYWHIN